MSLKVTPAWQPLGWTAPLGSQGTLDRPSADKHGKQASANSWNSVLSKRASGLSVRDVLSTVLQDEQFRWDLDDCCSSSADMLVNDSTGAHKLRVRGCHLRGLCPVCGAAYGRERGEERFGLFHELLSPGFLVGLEPAVKSLDFEFTLPAAISGYLDFLLLNRPDKCSKALTALSSAIRRTLEQVLGEGLGFTVDYHFWHSKDSSFKASKQKRPYDVFKPLTGPHWHAHVQLPNLRVIKGRPVGLVSRTGYIENINAVFPTAWANEVRKCQFVRECAADMGEKPSDLIPETLVINYQYAKDWGRVRHRSRYCARHPMQDLLGEKASLTAKHEGLPWFQQACERWQKIQTSRRMGWLANASLSRLGMSAVSHDEALEKKGWRKLPGLYILKRFTPKGVVCDVWLDGECQKDVLVPRLFCPSLVPEPEPRSFGWRAMPVHGAKGQTGG
jgi:hypothetical protein